MVQWLLSLGDEFRRNFRVADAVDILIIAILLYSVLIWFRETASRKAAIGVSILTGLYFLARALDMYLTSLVFHTGFAVLLIMLIVVFQEDLRKMFERVAGWGDLRGLREEADDATDVDLLAEAAFHLASKRIGALIVLPGQNPLDRHLNGGIPLGGRLSAPLLYSIFDTHSAGHDGAAVVEGDLVTRFACHLPISKNRREIGGQGTRHAAALGLSESSDALVLVVSEERGVLSVAQDGKLTELRDAPALKSRIERFLATAFPAEERSVWDRFVTHHAGMKVLAALLACLAWLALAYNPSTIQRTFVVPVEYRNVPKNLVLQQPAPNEAKLTLSGSERQFRFLEPNSMKVSVNLSQRPVGPAKIVITDEHLLLPADFALDGVEPRVLRLELHEEPKKPKPPEAQRRPGVLRK